MRYDPGPTPISQDGIVDFLGREFPRIAQAINAPVWERVVRTENETKNSDNTLADDAFLGFFVPANKLVIARLLVFYTSSANADFTYSIVGPSTPTRVDLAYRDTPGSSPNVTAQRATDFSTSFNSSAAGTGLGWVDGMMLLNNGANAGGVKFQWAQGASHLDNTTIYAGSFFEYAIIS